MGEFDHLPKAQMGPHGQAIHTNRGSDLTAAERLLIGLSHAVDAARAASLTRQQKWQAEAYMAQIVEAMRHV